MERRENKEWERRETWREGGKIKDRGVVKEMKKGRRGKGNMQKTRENED